MPSWKSQTLSAEFGEKPNESYKYFLVLGRKEVGKTVFINHLCGGDPKGRVAFKPNEGTQGINIWNFPEENIGFIDTPGFGNEGDNAPILLVSKIRQFLQETNITVSGMIIVDDIGSHIGLETDFIVSITKEFFHFDARFDNWGGSDDEMKTNQEYMDYNSQHKWKHVLFVRTNQDKVEGQKDFDEHAHVEEEQKKFADYFEIMPENMVTTGILSDGEQSVMMNKDHVLSSLHGVLNYQGILNITWRMNDWALAALINRNLRYKLGGLFTKDEDKDYIQNKVKPAMRGTKRMVIFKNSSNETILTQTYNENKQLSDTIKIGPKSSSPPNEFMVGETVIVQTEDNFLGIYIVEAEVQRKGQISINIDHDGHISLSHENSAEMLEIIGSCLKDWSDEKLHDDSQDRQMKETPVDRSKPESKKSMNADEYAQEKASQSNADRNSNKGAHGGPKSIQEIMKQEKLEKAKTRGIRK